MTLLAVLTFMNFQGKGRISLMYLKSLGLCTGCSGLPLRLAVGALSVLTKWTDQCFQRFYMKRV